MKYLKLFEKETDYQSFVSSSDYLVPNVCLLKEGNEIKCNDIVKYNRSFIVNYKYNSDLETVYSYNSMYFDSFILNGKNYIENKYNNIASKTYNINSFNVSLEEDLNHLLNEEGIIIDNNNIIEINITDINITENLRLFYFIMEENDGNYEINGGSFADLNDFYYIENNTVKFTSACFHMLNDISNQNYDMGTKFKILFIFTNNYDEYPNTFNSLTYKLNYKYCDYTPPIDLYNINSIGDYTINVEWNKNIKKYNFEEFFRLKNIKSISDDLFKDLNIIKTEKMFYQCEHLETINLNSLNFENVTNCYRMFDSCFNLKKADLTNCNFKNDCNLANLFRKCTNLIEVRIGKELPKNLMCNSMFSNVETNGKLYYNSEYDYSQIINEIPSTWEAIPCTLINNILIPN